MVVAREALELEDDRPESLSAIKKDAIRGFVANSGKNEVNGHYLE